MNGERYQQTWSQINRYEVIAEIGRGGMGVVYRAYEAALDRTIALKVLTPDLANQPGFVARLRREAISAARLRHPNIALLFEFGQADDTAFLAMEYVPGQPLRQLLEAGPLPPERALAILDQIGQALDYAHHTGIVHRDVKPSNILVGAGDQAMLIDFGLAEVSEYTLLTTDGTVFGTPHYMAPEQAAGRGADGRADQYALAAVAYEMLVGVPPFHGRSATAVVHAHIYDRPPPPAEQHPSLPAAVDTVLLRALAKQPDDRYGSLAEFLAALRAALTPKPAPAGHVRRRWRLLLGLVGVLALLGVLALAALLPRGAVGNGASRLSAGSAARAGVPLPRQVVWAYAAELNLVGGPAPVTDGGTLIVGTLDGQVLGLQAGTGELRWRVGGGSLVFGAPSAGRGLVYAGSSDGAIQALSLTSGKTTWKTKIVGFAQQAPALEDNGLVVSTDKGYIYLLQPGSGQIIWERPLAQSTHTPAIGGGRIFIVAGSTLYALDANDGAVDWTFDAAGAITTPPVLAGDMVVVGTDRGLLYALRIADGQPHLRYQASGTLSAAPAVGANAIYVADYSGALTALNPVNASVLWRFQAGAALTTAPLLAEGKLLLGAANGMFYALDARSGQQLARIELRGSVSSQATAGDGLIFVRADRMYALGE